MADFDNDLQSIQEARTLATQAREAQRKFLHAAQPEVDRICAAMPRRRRMQLSHWAKWQAKKQGMEFLSTRH